MPFSQSPLQCRECSSRWLLACLALAATLALCGCREPISPVTVTRAAETSRVETADAIASLPTSPSSPADTARFPARILVDSVHAHNYLTAGLTEEIYDYHQNNGYRLAFSFLQSQGVPHDTHEQGELSAALLDGYQLVFLNLASSDLPGFSMQEIQALTSYIHSGGSLLVITDHSNCYFHAHRLRPLMAGLDIQIPTVTVCEPPEHRLGHFDGWIDISNFASHPVTDQLRHLGFQTGGAVDLRHAVAFSSPQSFGDQSIHRPYREGGDAGNFGNWVQDADEPSGAQGVVAAKMFGQGRIVVVADQNIFGDSFLRYADNYRLWLNAVNWLLRREPALATRQAEAFAGWQSPRILCYEDYRQAAFGVDALSEHYNLLVALQRRYWTFASDDLTGQHDLILLADNHPLKPAKLALLLTHLRAGRPALLLRAAGHTFTDRQTLTGQLAGQLGQPRLAPFSPLADIASFPQTGQLIIATDHEALLNVYIAKPHRVPNAAQQKRRDELFQLIDRALK